MDAILTMLATIEFGNVPGNEQWDQLVRAHADFHPTTVIYVVNPFTRQPVEITSARKLIDIKSDGKTVGAFRWTIDDSGIEVYGSEEVIRPIAEQVASEIGATYTPI